LSIAAMMTLDKTLAVIAFGGNARP
jgi:hypothetical protein